MRDLNYKYNFYGFVNKNAIYITVIHTARVIKSHKILYVL